MTEHQIQLFYDRNVGFIIAFKVIVFMVIIYFLFTLYDKTMRYILDWKMNENKTRMLIIVWSSLILSNVTMFNDQIILGIIWIIMSAITAMIYIKMEEW